MKTFFVISSILLFFSCQSIQSEKQMAGEKDCFFFLYSDQYNFGESSNAALFITDNDSVEELKSLFINNDLLAEHQCGYDYQIQFYNAEQKEIEKYYYLNTECDVYSRSNERAQEFIQYFVKQLNTKPSYYVYNLKIEVNKASQDVINQLKKDSLDVFLLGETREQYPKIRLAYCEPATREWKMDDVEARFTEIEKNIEFGFQPLEVSKIDRTRTTRSVHVDYETDQVARMFYFPTETDIDKVIQNINALNIDYLYATSCRTHYYLQLFTKNNNLQELSQELSKYPFIMEVTEAKTGFLCQDCDLYYREK